MQHSHTNPASIVNNNNNNNNNITPYYSPSSDEYVYSPDLMEPEEEIHSKKLPHPVSNPIYETISENRKNNPDYNNHLHEFQSNQNGIKQFDVNNYDSKFKKSSNDTKKKQEANISQKNLMKMSASSFKSIKSASQLPKVNKNSKVKSPPSRYAKNNSFEPSYVFYESFGRASKSLGRTSKNIMRRVFDEDFALDSPGKKKIAGSSSGDAWAQPTSTSFNKGQKEDQTLNQTEVEENIFKVDYEYIEMCQKTYLDIIAAKSRRENLDEQISFALEMLVDFNQQMRIGAILTLSDLIYKNEKIIQPEDIAYILDNLYQVLPNFHEKDDTYMKIFTLELLSIIGPHNISFNHIKLLLAMLEDEDHPIAKDKVFQTLINLDYPGLNGLLDVANRDFNDLPLYILNKCAQCPEIQAKIIVPALVNELGSSDNKKRYSALVALNRMFNLLHPGGGLPILIALLQEGTLDRQLVASAIYCAGSIGEQTLIKMLKTISNPKIKQAICSVFAWRVSKYDKIKIKIKIVPYQVSQHSQYNPGTMCIYKGSLKSLCQIDVYDEEPTDDSNDYIEINSRDFMATLHRLLTIKYQEFAQEDPSNFDIPNINRQSVFGEYHLHKYLQKDLNNRENEQNLGSVSPNIIKALINATYDNDPSVRESSVKSLGLIGMPEAAESVEACIKCLFDPDAQIRATAAWTIGRLGQICCSGASKRLITLLRDNYWKVRTAACISLGYMGQNIDPSPFGILLKVLKEGTINKLTVCETLVRLGVEGEQILLDLLKTLPNSNYVLKASIIQSLELANVNMATIDFVIEELFKNANDNTMQVRKACLYSLEKLRARSQNNNITYLKSRNILPLFYYFLQDSSAEIKNMALNSIYSFGPQGELLLIEGLTKDKNPTIRIECAKGLSMYGAHTFRAIIFGLRDTEENVRNATAHSILKSFSPKDIINEFKYINVNQFFFLNLILIESNIFICFRDKHHQKPAIICSLKEILGLNYYYSKEIRKFLEEILAYFQNEINIKSFDHSSTINGTLNGSINAQEKTYEQNEQPSNANLNQKSMSYMKVEDNGSDYRNKQF